MEGRNGDTAQADDADSSSSTEANWTWLSGSWISEEWLSRKRLSEWTNRDFYQSRKAAVVLFLVVLIAGIGGGGYYWYLEAQEGRRQQQIRKTVSKLSNPIHWPTNRVTTLDAKFQLVTKWVPRDGYTETPDYTSGQIKYKLMVHGYPNVLEDAWSSDLNSSYFITVRLLDKDGFKISSIKITLNKLTRTVNPRGEGIGFSIQGSEAMSLRKYRRIDDWKVAWNL